MKNFISRLSRKSNPSGFTLIEIVIVIIAVAILIALAMAYYYKMIAKSENSEALINLGAIREAELATKSKLGTYLNATNTSEINDKLALADISDKTFRYKVVNATSESFVAVAERLKEGLENLTEKDLTVIAMASTGDVSYSSSSLTGSIGAVGGGFGGTIIGGGGSGGSGGGGIGGGAGGGSGGGAGGSSGGGSGGSSGGGTGGTTGGSTGGTGETTGGSGAGTGISSIFSGAPTAIANDGLVNLSWDITSGADVVYYSIYRSTANEGGPYEPLVGRWPVSATYFSDSDVTNGQTYYYRIDAVYSSGAYSSSPIASATPSASSSYAVASAAAFSSLAASVSGAEISQRITLYDTKIGFGSGVSGALAWFSPYFNTITFDLDEFGNSNEVHAALLAHEGTHAWWDHDPTQGEPERETNGDTIDQEYNAFLAGANVWNEVKGSETDYQMDSWAEIIGEGEASAKETIRIYYSGLPEY